MPSSERGFNPEMSNGTNIYQKFTHEIQTRKDEPTLKEERREAFVSKILGFLKKDIHIDAEAEQLIDIEINNLVDYTNQWWEAMNEKIKNEGEKFSKSDQKMQIIQFEIVKTTALHAIANSIHDLAK